MPGSPVKKQQRLRLQHVATRKWLHSHLFQSPLSGNQEVSGGGHTAAAAATRGLSVLQPSRRRPRLPPTPARSPSRLCPLRHPRHRLPRHRLPRRRQVSAFGSDAQSDGGDVWRVDWDAKAKYWKQDNKVIFQHVDTGAFLHSLRQATFGHPIAGQHEVCAVRSKSGDSLWYAAEGVYLPRADKKTKGEAEGGGGGGGSGAKDEL
jgi:dolichyl-phosphate-mannose--protein O-mannosyl transferase